jgi:ATP-dependent helicase HrpB
LIALPIDDVLPQIVRALSQSDCLVLRAPTGAGKTTRVPPAILDAGLADGRQILLLQPRRLAARTSARRMADERGVALGEEVGYQVRFERRAGPRTKILVVTEGILTRMLQEDPFLESAGAVILDEFHERHLDTDLALGMTRRVQQTVRPDLKLVVMSATLAVESVSQWLGGCPIVDSPGRLFPVTIEYSTASESGPVAPRVAAAVRDVIPRTPGDVLVFLPGVGEIRQAARVLKPFAETSGFVVRELYGDLPPDEQDAVLLRGSKRKVILSTNVAETSVTIEGITAVIDAGTARVMHFDSHVGLDRLRLQPISRASAEQRAGRAGRLQEGLCVRLWSEASHRARPEQETPEIRRVDLAGSVLQLRCWGEADVRAFPWFEPPREGTIARAERVLTRLQAMDDAGPTELGRAMARLPVHPRLAQLMLEASRNGCPERGALAAALLSERDPFRGEDAAVHASQAGRRPPSPAGPRRAVTRSDLLDRVLAMEEFDRSGRDLSPLGTINHAAARFVFKARDQLMRLIDRQQGTKSRTAGRGASGSVQSPEEGFLKAVFAAFPDRLARRREAGGPRGVMVGGKGVILGPESAVRESEYFVCLDVDAGQGEARVRQASAVDREWITAAQTRTTIDVVFDETAERVSARRRVRFDDLILEEGTAALPSGDETSDALAQAAAAHWSRIYPPDSEGVAQFVTRVRCLREWMPDLDLPVFDDADLQSMLPLLAVGCRSFAELRRVPWIDILRTRLTRAQSSAVDREAPERIEVPSGNRITLAYEPGRPPVLAVRIQEVFGLKETPRVAGGRVRVLMHLLAPNMRPQQITDDLASFWANGYPLVRKELRARYPKHSWPEDPTDATPQRRPGRK